MNGVKIPIVPAIFAAYAIEPFESYFPRTVGLIAGGLVVAFVLIASASSGVARALAARRIESLFVKVRYFEPSSRPSVPQEAYLMSLSPHRVTLLAKQSLRDGTSVTVDAPGETPKSSQRFHAKVLRSRPTRGPGGWFMLRLAVPHVASDEKVVQRELSLLRRAPADQTL